MAVDGEREIADFLAGAEQLGGDPVEQPSTRPPETPDETEEVVHDVRPGEEPPPEAPTLPAAEVPEAEELPAETEDEPNAHVAWAKQKYGEDTERWARAMYEQEQYIGRISAEKKQAEEYAGQAIQYAQQVEAQAQAAPSGMPLSSAEEMWVEQNLANPAGAAYTAARQGNIQLYSAVIDRIAEESPQMAAQIGTQVQLALAEEQRQAQAQQAAAQNGQPERSLETDLGQTFQRLGINVQTYGPAMMEKIQEIGEYHPYTLAILGGDPIQRDLATQAVYDLVRSGQTTRTRVGQDEREAQIRREGELRRGAAGVVTGSPHQQAASAEPQFMQDMEAEWKRRGQWTDGE